MVLAPSSPLWRATTFRRTHLYLEPRSAEISLFRRTNITESFHKLFRCALSDCNNVQVGTPSASTNADPLLLDLLPFLDTSRRCEESRFLAKTSAYHPPHPLILLTTFACFKPSGNINPLLTLSLRVDIAPRQMKPNIRKIRR